MRLGVTAALVVVGIVAATPARGQSPPVGDDEPRAPRPDGQADDAAPADRDAPDKREDRGYIGGALATPEVDSCEPPVGLTEDQVFASASEHYQRGNTLYIQGDYEGAIIEFVAAYCDAPHYEMLKNIAQSYERLVEYEKTVAYLSRYILELPRDQVEERDKMSFRVEVLSNLPAQLRVATVPPRATVTLTGATGVNARETANDKKRIKVRKGTYEMRVEKDGYEPIVETIEVEIGQPYSYYYRLHRKQGSVRVVTQPSTARIFLDQKLVAIGSYVERLPIGQHTITVEAREREPATRTIEVTANQTTNLRIELEKQPKSGRRELLVASTIAGGIYGGGAFATLFSDSDPTFKALASLAGFGVGFAGAYLGVPNRISVGQSSYLIGASIIGAAEGGLLAALIACDNSTETGADGEVDYKIKCPPEAVASTALIAGIASSLTAAITADRLDLSAGDAALLNSGAMWGSIGSSLFVLAFDSDGRLWMPLMLAGLNLGTIAGGLLAQRIEASRSHIALIDLSGLGGMIVGVSLVDVIEPGSRSERLPHFALIGMAAGLITGTYLTRHMDDPKSAPLGKLKPELGAARDIRGQSTMTFGLGASF